MTEKSFTQSYSIESPTEAGSSDVFRFNGTNEDANEMLRMGKKQQLKRDFGFLSMFSFVIILQASWEGTLLVSSFGLYNGGTAGVIWCTVAVWVCLMAMIASMAEMAEMAPTSGGQYHWVSEFAPPSFEKSLSYVVGWFCCLGWVSGIPACGQILSGLVQGMILLVNPDVNITSLWQTTLLIFFWLFLTFGFNIFLSKYLPVAESIVCGVHCIAFVAFMGVLWGMSDIAPAKDVFTSAVDGGGWGNIGLSTLVGLVTPIWCFTGPDAGAHMSEELEDASLHLPRAMVWATFLQSQEFANSQLTLHTSFRIGDVTTVLNSPTGVPIIQVVYNSTQSTAATCVMASVLVILAFFGSITLVAASSRQCWAFARDGGFPYSSWLTEIRSINGATLPLNSMLVCLAISLVFSFFPVAPVVGDPSWAADFNWAVVMFAATCALAFAYYFFGGREKYVNTVRLVKKE